MNQSQSNNPLHGITLKAILEYLVAEYGWERLTERIQIDSFRNEPSIHNSLKFLGNTDSARAKVERLYLHSVSYDERHRKDNADHRSGSCWFFSNFSGICPAWGIF